MNKTMSSIVLMSRYLYSFFLLISIFILSETSCLGTEAFSSSISDINNKLYVVGSLNFKNRNVNRNEIIHLSAKTLAQETSNIENEKLKVETKTPSKEKLDDPSLPNEDVRDSALAQLKPWDVLSTFIVTLPAIISALTGLIGVFQIRRFYPSGEEARLNRSINWLLFSFFSGLIILGIVASLILSRWQRSNDALIQLTEQQVDNIVSASLEEFKNNQDSQLSELIKENLSPTNSDVQSINKRIQSIETKIDNFETIQFGASKSSLNFNAIIVELFKLIRWTILISIASIFGLRILGFLFRAGNDWLNSFLRDGELRRQEERLRAEERRRARD